MYSLLTQFWADDRGCLATECMLVASILTLSALATLAALHQAGW